MPNEFIIKNGFFSQGNSSVTGDLSVSGTITSTSNINLSGFTNGSVLFASGSTGLITGSTNLFWDNTNGRLGIGTSSPTAPLQVSSTVNADRTGRSVLINNTLNATANNDQLVGLDIAPTFNFSTFTGVTSTAIRVAGRIIPNAPNNQSIGDAGIPFNNAFFGGIVFTNTLQNYTSNIDFSISYTNRARLWTTGNFTIQNGGSYTDAGFRLDVNGTARIQNQLTTTGSITASSSIARGTYLNQTLVASANNDVLSSLDILTTYNSGSFTGVQNYGLRLINSANAPNALFVNSPTLLTQGSIWNSSLGPRTMAGGMLVSAATYPQAGFNIAQTVSKISFILGTDNALPSEVMFINSNGKMGINGGLVGLAPNTNNIYNLTLDNGGTATTSITFNSNKLVLKGKAWNSAQGSALSMGYLMMSNIVNNANPTTDKLSFYVGSANFSNQGDTNGNATERLSLRTDGIFSFFNSSTTEILRLFNSGNLLLQNGGTFTDAGYRLDVNGTTRIQDKLSVGTPTESSAVVEITSTNGGLLIPRMTSVQKLAITSPAVGLMVFDTNNNITEIYDPFWEWMPIANQNDWMRRWGMSYWNDFGVNNGFSDGVYTTFATNGGGQGIASNPIPAFSNVYIGYQGLRTGVNSNGTAQLRTDVNIGGYVFFGNGKFQFESRVFIRTLSTGTDRYNLIVGFSNSTSSTMAAGCTFIYDEGGVGTGTLVSPNWQIMTAFSSVRTVVDTGVAVSASTFYNFRVDINDNSTVVNYYLNDILVRTETTNIPPDGTRVAQPIIGITKTVGTTDIGILVDYIGLKKKFRIPR
jgi:hypothetical protein